MIAVPYVHGMLNEATARAVVASRQPHCFYDLDPGDEAAYGRLLRQLWTGHETLVVVEHDVIPTGTDLFRMVMCPRRWCCAPYGSGPYSGFPHLGLAKFSRQLQLDWPLAMERALLDSKWHRDPVHWRWVGDAIIRDLATRGETCHEHWPPVEHAHAVA